MRIVLFLPLLVSLKQCRCSSLQIQPTQVMSLKNNRWRLLCCCPKQSVDKSEIAECAITSALLFSEFYPDYFTATILEWKHLLKQDKYKEIIVSSLEFVIKESRLKVYAFCIMSNHIHLIWQVQAGHHPKDVQLSFLKYAAQMIIKDLRNNHNEVLGKFKVKASDRTYPIWERNALSNSL